MIDDMAVLKQAMEQMDAEDPDVAQAAKDRAAETLGKAQLSFSKIAELIEQRRLLLRPRIVAGIKRMDQPGMIGDAAFRDAGSALRREGQSFRQIAEAIEFSTRPGHRYEDPVPTSEPLHPMMSAPLYDMPVEPGDSAWVRVLFLVASIVFFPLRHPIRFLTIALVAYLLFYALRGAVPSDGVAAIRQSADKAMSSVSSFVNAQILRRPKEVTALPAGPTPASSAPGASPAPSPTPSPLSSSATSSAHPAIGPVPSANTPAPPASPPPAPASAAPASPSAAPAGPPVSPPRRDAKSAPPSKSATNCGTAPGSRPCGSFEDDRSRAFDDIIPQAIRRRSRGSGPCIAGIGGCNWGGVRY